MLSLDQIEQAAEALFVAEQTQQQIGLLSLQYPHMDMHDAYRIQNAFVAKKIVAGEQQTGWKIGLTSKAMQNALHIDIPDSGVLFNTMHFDNQSTVPANRFIQPRVEAEIAFVMKADVDQVSEQGILAATNYVCAAIEILDTRITRRDAETGKMRTVFDTISDNAANAGVVLADQHHDPSDLDLRWLGVILKRNGEVEETGLGAAVLDNPLTSMLWLVKRLAQYGQKVRAGDVVLSGSLVKMIEAPPGSTFLADFNDFGQVQIAFA